MDNSIKARLLAFISELDISTSAFERQAGLSNGYVAKMTEKPSKVKLRSILAAFPILNMEWVLTGIGDMILPPDLVNKNKGSISGKLQQAKTIQRIDHITGGDIFAPLDSVIINEPATKNQMEREEELALNEAKALYREEKRAWDRERQDWERERVRWEADKKAYMEIIKALRQDKEEIQTNYRSLEQRFAETQKQLSDTLQQLTQLFSMLHKK